MPLDKDRERAKKRAEQLLPGGDTPVMLMFDLAAIHERVLACIADNTVRAQWDAKLDAQMNLLFKAVKEPTDG